jgi:muramoyltetrapeptide carboxypeptidase
LNPVIPPKLQPGDRIHVTAPSRSLTSICKSDVEREGHALSIQRLESLGLRVTLAAHVWESDPFDCPTIEHRLADLHDAFRDPEVAGIITVIGGWNGNQILDRIDYDLVAANPKVFCGYSDITVFQGAFLRLANLVTYSGPHISTFGMKHGIAYTLESFQNAVMRVGNYRIEASQQWADDSWFLDQEARTFIDNPGHVVLQPGEAEGRIIGGNLCTLGLLQGTPYMPDIRDCLLFLEDLRDLKEFDRLLQSLLQGPGGDTVRGLVIGRFPNSAGATRALLDHVVATKPALRGKPVIYGADFGHTTPHATFPIGGTAWISADSGGAQIEVREH